MNCKIAQPFFESAQEYPDKLALFGDGETYTYRDGDVAWTKPEPDEIITPSRWHFLFQSAPR